MSASRLRRAVRCSAAWGEATAPYTVQSDNTLKVRFSATVGEEPEVEVALV
jgi:hypothetical protein